MNKMLFLYFLIKINMKNIKLNTSILMILTIVFFAAGCVNKTFEDLELETYSVDFEANKFVGDLKAEYTGEVLDLIEEDIIIKGTVIANDESGNFYKTIIIQDSLADGTQAGIEIQLNETGLHNKYPIGQMVYVKCKGLYLGNYEGVVKLGVDYEGDIGRIPSALIDKYLFKADGGMPVKPRVVSVSELDVDVSTDISNVPNVTTVFRSQYVNTLIKIENCEFYENELSRTYADVTNKITSEVAFYDIGGNSAILRTSGYATFAGDQVAQGSGTIVAVYNPYRTDKQFYVRDLNDIQLNLGRLSTRVEMYSFYSSLGNFTQFNVTGSQIWVHDSQYHCALMSGFNGSSVVNNEDWLISPAQNFSSYSKVTLFFSHAAGMYGATWDDLTLQVSADYDGTSNPATQGTWVSFSDFIENPTWTFKSSGPIDISQFAGQSNVYFAFKYISVSKAAKWEIASVAILPE